MPFDVRVPRNAVVSILGANNTTTSSFDLSSGLSSRVVEVLKGSVNHARPAHLYPVVYVNAESKTEEIPAAIGSGARRNVDASYAITGVTMNSGSHVDAHDEIYVLTNNIERVLRNYVDLSATVAFTEILGTEWTTEDRDAAYVHAGTVHLRTRSIST